MAHDALGIALTRTEDYDDSIAAFERAIDLNPSDFYAYVSIGLTLTLAGRPDEGIVALEKGFQLNPHDPRNHLFFAFMARAQLTAQHYGEAVDWAKKSIRWRSDILQPHMILASSLGHLGRLEEAREAIAECHRIDSAYMTRQEDWYHYKRDADTQHFLEGLRKAGWEG